MTYPPGPDRNHGSQHPDLPDDLDPVGVPRATSGHEAFLLTVAVMLALLGLAFTLGWIVVYHLSS